MDGSFIVGVVVLSGVMVLFIGHSWIDSFFKQKEELIKRTTQYVKGEM
jgi:hypothetical protein